MNDLTFERNFPVAPDKVFAFVTQTQFLLKWWGPESMHVPEHDMDFTRTGPWVSVMVNVDGGRFKVSGEVVAVDVPNSVEFTWGWHNDEDQRGHESNVRFDVKDNGEGGSLFTLTHSGLPDDESRNNHTGGWTSSLRKLDRVAEGA